MSRKIKDIVNNSEFVKTHTRGLDEEEKVALAEYTEKITSAFQLLVDHYRAKSMTDDGKKEIQGDINEQLGYSREGWGESDETGEE